MSAESLAIGTLHRALERATERSETEPALANTFRYLFDLDDDVAPSGAPILSADPLRGLLEHKIPGTSAASAPRGSRGTATRRLLDQRNSTRVATGCCVLLGMCLLSPSLWTGLDRSGLEGVIPESVSASSGPGVLSWWASPRLLLSSFGLASFTHQVDQALWPSHPLLIHLQSLLWFGLLIGIVGAAYRRFGALSHGFSLALLLFAVADSHAPLVGSVESRNAVVALCFALPALLLHDRQRRTGFAHGSWLGPLCLSAGLLTDEVAISVFAYLFAYAACFDRGRWYARFGSLLPYAAVVGAWTLSRIQLGDAVLGAGLNVDALRDPFGFALAVCERLPLLAVGMLAAPFADFWALSPTVSPTLRVGVMALALVVLGLFALALRPLVSRHARLHFWAMGTALALLSTCAASRDLLLIGPAIGAMAVIAEMIEVGWARRDRVLPALGMAALAVVHLIVAPVLTPMRAAGVGQLSELLRVADGVLAGQATVREPTLGQIER